MRRTASRPAAGPGLLDYRRRHLEDAAVDMVDVLNRDREADKPAAGLTEHEKYLFDIHGYIVVKQALNQAQLADCRARLQARLKTKRFGSDRTFLTKDAGAGQQAWDAPSLSEALPLAVVFAFSSPPSRAPGQIPKALLVQFTIHS